MTNYSTPLNSPSVNPLKKELAELTQDRIKQYIAQEKKVEESLQRNPHYPQKQKDEDRVVILHRVETLEGIFKDIFPYIKKVRSYISKVTDQNKYVACYFLFGKISQSFQSLFLLAREGFHYEVMELIRTIRESIDLISLFLFKGDQNPYLEKWFKGEIISNKEARKAMSDFINKESMKVGQTVPVEKMKAGVYGGLSKYSHVSYGALLDSYDVFNRDFDFERISGFHYTRTSSLPYAKGEIEATIIALKQFYQTVGDMVVYKELSSILRTIAPQMHDERIKDLIQATIEKYR